MSTALTVIEDATGEVVARDRLLAELPDATDERLGDITTAFDNLQALLDQLREDVSAEALKRLDKAMKWTRRVGDATVLGYQYEIKAPSPSAGAVKTDADRLAPVLDELVAEDMIDDDAAAAALKRTVTVTFTCASAGEQAELEALAKADDRSPKVATSTSVVQAGVNALLKSPDVKKRVEAVQEPVKPVRKATIKRVEKKR